MKMKMKKKMKKKKKKKKKKAPSQEAFCRVRLFAGSFFPALLEIQPSLKLEPSMSFLLTSCRI